MKVMIQSKKSNILDFLTSYLNNEKIDYILESDYQEDSDITDILYVVDEEHDLSTLTWKEHISYIIFNSKKEIVSNQDNMVINYIITNLIEDRNPYNDVQKDYLLRKGIYKVLSQNVNELLENKYSYNGMIYDMTAIKLEPNNWIFKFDSINDTYAWLARKSRIISFDCIQKNINFYSEKVYNDSLKEINYLSQQILNIKNKKSLIDIFICSKEELEKFKRNYFFKSLLKNISDTYSMYFIEETTLMQKENLIYSKLLDGICIYDDCVYLDTYDDELSLGFVDCNEKTIKEYNEYFDYILNTYAKKLKMDGEIDEF